MTVDIVFEFEKGLKAKDFAQFYATLSKKWKAQTTPADLNQVFKKYTDANKSIGLFLKSEVIIVGTPAIDTNGILIVESRLDRTDNPWEFRLKFIKEDGEWKLMGIYANAQ